MSSKDHTANILPDAVSDLTDPPHCVSGINNSPRLLEHRANVCANHVFVCCPARRPRAVHKASRPTPVGSIASSILLVWRQTHDAFFMFSLKHGSLLPCGSSSENLNKPSTTHSDGTRKLHLFQAPETRDGKENDNDPDWPTVLRPTFSPIRDAKSETHVTCIGFLRETTKETECSTLQPHLHVILKTWRFQNGRCKKKNVS